MSATQTLESEKALEQIMYYLYNVLSKFESRKMQ